MQKEDIRIKRVIIHILNPAAGLPVLSEVEVEFGSDFADFLRDHIYKIMSSDDCKKCKFYEKESEIYQVLASYREDHFIPMSQDIANHLYQIMSSNVDIPPADLVIVRFKADEREYLALLKMNYMESFTHKTRDLEEGKENEAAKHKAILPMGSRLKEAAMIAMDDLSIQAIEKKYEVNGEKTNYFTSLFLKCSSELSHKSKLSIVTKAVEKVQNNYYDEEQLYEQVMRAKSIIHETLQENGSFKVEELSEKIFGNDNRYSMKAEFHESMEKYDLVKQEIAPRNEGTVKKYAFQNLQTDTGIEIKIPMEQYKDSIQVVRENGNISLHIKNIMQLKAKF